MTEKHSRTHGQTNSKENDDEILVGDIVKYLSAQVRLQSVEKTGNIPMSKAISRLVNALRPYSDLPMSEAMETFSASQRGPARKHDPGRDNPSLPDQLGSVDIST